MLESGGMSAWIFSFWIDMPVCDPPFGNATHSVHLGRMHSCPNTVELAATTAVAARTITPRIHVLHSRSCPAGEITRFRDARTAPACSRMRGSGKGVRSALHEAPHRHLGGPAAIDVAGIVDADA